MPKSGTEWRAAAIGITGHGDFGHGLHIPFRHLPGFRMVAVSDPDEGGRAKAMAASGAERGYADYREMLAKEAPDVVSVCPRHAIYHEEMVVAAAEAGCHIYCEKPIAPDLESADRMVSACERHHVRMAVSHQSRYVEPFLTAREMLRRGEIGQLLSVHGRGKEDRRGGGEDMMVLGTHIMDLMRFLAGDPEWVFGHVTFAGRGVTPQDAVMATEAIGPVAGDSVHAVYGFANGVRGYFVTHRGRHVRGPRMGVALVGTEGTLSLRYGSPTRLSRCRAPGAPEDAGPWEEVPILPGPLAPGDTESAGLDALSLGNRLAVWDLVQAAQEGREPVSSGKDARHALEMILGVYASHLAESRLPLPLTNRRHPLTP